MILRTIAFTLFATFTVATTSAKSAQEVQPLYQGSPGSEFKGPEGLSSDEAGNLYVGCVNGRLFRISRRGELSKLADFSCGSNKARAFGPQLRGVLVSGQQIFFAVNNDKRTRGAVHCHDLRTGKQWPVAIGLGTPNGLAIDAHRGILYVTDSGPPLAFGLKASSLWAVDLRAWQANKTAPQTAVSLGRFKFPNGLALTQDGERLYLSQTGAASGTGRIQQLDLRFGTGRLPCISGVHELARVSGWPDGILLSRDETRLLVALQKTGRIAVLPVGETPKTATSGNSKVREIQLRHRSETPGIASLAWISSKGETLAFTDLWTPNQLRILTRYDANLRRNVHKLQAAQLR